MHIYRQAVYLVAVAVAFSGFLMPGNHAKALTISPTRIELAADPGSSASGTFKLFNEQSTDQTLYIKFVNFEPKDETGEPVFVPGGNGLPRWVSAPESVRARAKEYTSVDFTINVPWNAEPGGYFAGIFASRTAPESADGGDVTLQSEVGSLILFRVNGQFAEGETILEFDTKNRKHWLTSLPVEFYYRFQNSGDDRIKPLGDITIKNMFGGTTKVINANRTVGSVLPKSIRRYDAAWVTGGGGTENEQNQIPQQPENLSFAETLKWQWQHFALGRYTANIQLTINNDAARSYAQSVSFWVVPWELVGTVAGAAFVVFSTLLGIAVLIVMFVFKRRKS